jgi:thiol-disulfide isomerase/thioredoxin
MAKIFISYRREDSEWPANEIYTAIRKRVGNPDEDVFIDVDHIPFGVNFKNYIHGIVAKCDVLLALIGRGWLDVRDPETNKRRLDNPDDLVRIEIASALERGVKVVPVLLDGTLPPRQAQLPDDLKQLSLYNGIEINRRSFNADVERLLAGLRLRPTHESPRGLASAEASADLDVRVADTSDAEFEADVVHASNSLPVIVLFWAPWCGVCARLRPELEKAVRDAERPLRLVKLNVEENPSVPKDLNIRGVPSVYSYYQGYPVDGFMGRISSLEGLKDFINRQLERTSYNQTDR